MQWCLVTKGRRRVGWEGISLALVNKDRTDGATRSEAAKFRSATVRPAVRDLGAKRRTKKKKKEENG